MKKFSLLALVGLMAVSCSKFEDFDLISQIQDADLQAITVTDLPNEAQNTLDESYFETYVEDAFGATDLGFKVNLSDGNEVFFNADGDELNECADGEKDGKAGKGKRGKKGRMKGGEALDISTLPQAITDYVTANYADATIERAKQTRDDNIIVAITDHVFLVFDIDGNFIEVAQFVHGHKGTKLDLADVPTIITDYVANNYTNAEIKVAFQKDEGYRVGITTDEGRTMLIFDADGNFVEERTCNGNE